MCVVCVENVPYLTPTEIESIGQALVTGIAIHQVRQPAAGCSVLGLQPGDRRAVSGDDHGLAGLHRVQEGGEVR